MKKKRLLVVEDDHSMQGLIKLIFNVLEIPIHQAYNLKETLSLLKKNNYDYVLLDLNLPDSKECDTIRAVKAATDDRVIIITGIDDCEIKKECIALGVHDFVYKGQLSHEYFASLKEEKK